MIKFAEFRRKLQIEGVQFTDVSISTSRKGPPESFQVAVKLWSLQAPGKSSVQLRVPPDEALENAVAIGVCERLGLDPAILGFGRN